MGNSITDGWTRQAGREFNLWMARFLQHHGYAATATAAALHAITEQCGEGSYRLTNEHGTWALYSRAPMQTVTDERSSHD